MQMAKSVKPLKPLNRQGQQGEKPTHQQAVGTVMRYMF